MRAPLTTLRWLRAITDVLLPGSCPACGELQGIGPEAPLCAGCAPLIDVPHREFPAPEFVRVAWALGPYAGLHGALVRCGKSGGRTDVLELLGRRLAVVAHDMERPDVVMAVPGHWRRVARRGGDPTRILAAPVARALGVPLARGLRRVREASQVGRGRAQRNLHVRESYTCGDPGVTGDVLLIDDVLTTGATASACAQELLGSGVRSVSVLCVAYRSVARCDGANIQPTPSGMKGPADSGSTPSFGERCSSWAAPPV